MLLLRFPLINKFAIFIIVHSEPPLECEPPLDPVDPPLNGRCTPLRKFYQNSETNPNKNPALRLGFLFGSDDGGIRIIIAHAGGVCMSRCAHRRIPLFLFRVPRKRKRNAGESLHLRQNRIAILTKVAILFYYYRVPSSFFAFSTRQY